MHDFRLSLRRHAVAIWYISLCGLMLVTFSSVALAGEKANKSAIDIGDRLELFVDDWLIERMNGAHLELHKPTPRGVVIVHDAPWEGRCSHSHVILREGDTYRMWYRGLDYDTDHRKYTPIVVGYAESDDGIHWTRPELGLIEFQGSKKNNIVWIPETTRHPPDVPGPSFVLAPFKDLNAAAADLERYKGVAAGLRAGVYGYVSPDGIHWEQIGDGPMIRETFFMDYERSAFWDPNRGKYVAYLRDWWPDGRAGDSTGNYRAVRYVTSDDFRHWSKPKRVKFNIPLSLNEQLYTNQIKPYHRAPHLYLGFPMRYTHGRSDNCTNDGVFMTSRDGVNFKLWREAIIRPGLQDERWMNRNNHTALGVVETKSVIHGLPNELSIYSSEGYYGGPDGLGQASRLRRYTYRMDGFISVQAPPEGGEFVTKPLTFAGKQLVLNFSTSGAGYIRVEIQDPNGTPIKGFALADSPTVYGDNIEYVMRWQKRGGKKGEYTGDVSRLAGQPVRLRFVMKEADLFALRFREQAPKEKSYTGFAIPGSKVVLK